MKLRYSIMIILLMTLIMNSTGCQKKIEEEPKVVFQDQTFQAVFDRSEYKVTRKEFLPILPTQSQLDQITALSLFFSSEQDCSLKDLDKFPNLRGLWIINANQSVIQQVSEQEQLKVLWITVHAPVDMSPLGSMDNIKALTIDAPGEEAGKFDWSFIKELDQLETLCMMDINLNDVDFLKSLPNLERIIIERSEIEDITDLKTLVNLKYFRIQASNSDYSAVLENMNHLEQLLISEAKISDWTFLKDMRDLNWLSIDTIGNVKLPKWLVPENYPYLSALYVDSDILNANREILDQILPVLDERKKENEPEPQLSDPRFVFPAFLELMMPVEIYDD